MYNTAYITKKQLREKAKKLGLVISFTPYNEYRINFPSPFGTEATAYYTSDADDASITMECMAVDYQREYSNVSR